MRRALIVLTLIGLFFIPLAGPSRAADCGECCLSAVLAGLQAYTACGSTPECVGELISATYEYHASHCPSCNCELP